MRLKDKFEKEIRVELQKELGLKSVMAVPTLKKIVLNSGLGEALKDQRVLENMVEDMTRIAGQKAVATKSKTDISNFNRLKKGDKIGASVTLRSDKMWSFFDKLVSVVLPGVRDFRGVSRKSMDGAGNYSLGIKQHTVFFEVDQNRIDKPRGLQVTIQTTAKDDESAYLLLKKLGMPFRD
jgi:large subunit ribosomal protein L5